MFWRSEAAAPANNKRSCALLVFIFLAARVIFGTNGAAAQSAIVVPSCDGITVTDQSSKLFMDRTGKLCVSGSGSGGAATIADGDDVAEGAKADGAYAGSGSASLIAIVKGIYTAAQAIVSAINSSAITGYATAANQEVTAAGTSATSAQGVQGVTGGVALPIIGSVSSQVSINNAAATPHLCGSHVFKHITTATDTQIVPASGSTNIYVCDYSISFNGTGNIYLEKAASGTCATLTQIDQAWYGVANAGKLAAKEYYHGLNTGASAQLCANTSAGVAIDISVDYDQY